MSPELSKAIMDAIDVMMAFVKNIGIRVLQDLLAPRRTSTAAPRHKASKKSRKRPEKSRKLPAPARLLSFPNEVEPETIERAA
jgi:hypothetical protein